MGVAFVPLYIKYLGVEAYGLIGIFALLQAWLTLVDVGLRPTLTREMARFAAGSTDLETIRDLLRSIETVGVAIAAAVALGIAAASHWLATAWVSASDLPPQVIANAIAVMGVVAALRFLEDLYVSGIYGLQRQVLPNVVTVVAATIRGLGGVGVLAWVSPTVVAFFLWQMLLSIVTLLVFARILHRALPVPRRAARFSISALASIRKFAAGMIWITVLSLLLTQVDKILLTHLLALKYFSYYELAGTVAGTLNSLTGPIATAFYPRFTELVTRGDEEALRLAYHKGAQLVAVVVGTAAIVLIAFGDRLMFLWTGNMELTSHVVPLLPVLTLGTLLNGLMWIPYQLQLAYGWTSLAIRVNTVAVAVLVPAIIVVVPRYGGLGAAWVWVLLNTGYLIFVIYFMHLRVLRSEKWSWYRHDTAVPLAAAAAVAVSCRWLAPTEGGRLPESIILFLISCAALCAAVISAPLIRSEAARYLKMWIE
jgi:O-antigen/teichoic acid export membrane protein